VLVLKTNLVKSELVPVGYVNNVVGLAGILGCGVVSSFEVSLSSIGGIL
jgi:hypothetical protein